MSPLLSSLLLTGAAALLLIWAVTPLIWWVVWWLSDRHPRPQPRPRVTCGSCARRGNGCPIAPRDYAAPIHCIEHRPLQPALRTLTPTPKEKRPC